MDRDYTENMVNNDHPDTPVSDETVVNEETVVSEETVVTEESGAKEESAVQTEESVADESAPEAVEEAAEEVQEEAPAKPEQPASDPTKRAVPSRPYDPVKKAEKVNTVKKPLLSEAAKKRLLGLIFPIAITLVIILGVLYVVSHKENKKASKDIEPHRYEGGSEVITLENNDLLMTFHPDTTHFEITVKSTGEVWRSNPEMGNTTVPFSAASKSNPKEWATLIIQYGSENKVTGQDYDNYNYSVSRGVYDVEATSDYIKVMYSIGDLEKEYKIPPVTTKEKYLAWTSQMSKDDAAFVKRLYKEFDINNPDKNETNEEYKPEKLKENYPIYETEVIYVLRSTAKEPLKIKAEGLFEAVGYTDEDYEADKALSNAASSSDKPFFNVNVYYRLDGKDLVVEVPYNEIELNIEANPLTTITPLPYFGAADANENDGYLFVPEGGGALIRFNNGKISQGSYGSKVYGRDKAVVTKTLVNDPISTFNVFGIVKQKASFLCILEEGASYASVNADISGKTSNKYLNYVNAKYNAAIAEQYDLGDQASTSVYVYADLPQESIIQRYRFIDSGNYYDMAQTYKNYLKAMYPNEFTVNNDTEAPVVVEIVTAADKVKQVLGVPTSRPLKLTTFKEAKELMETLKNDGFNNMSVKVTGWMNGGVNQKILKKVKLVGSLGSSGDLKKLTKAASDAGIDLYLDGVTQYAYDSDIFDGFNSFTDSARFISKERAKIYQYSAVTFAQREGAEKYYLLHADLNLKNSERLYNAAKKYNANVSFRETGSDLSADYYKKKVTTREAARKEQMDQLSKFTQDSKIMINSGNVYAAVYSDVITNMNLRGNEYNIIDEFVPFYQMALHGYKNYVGNPINLAKDPTQEVLLSAEYGAGLQFTIMKESPFALQKTLYTEYFGANFDSWHEKMVSIYTRYNKELGHVYNQEMIGHVTLDDGLTCTTYADGTKVYVNYDYASKTANGKLIPARDYLVVR